MALSPNDRCFQTARGLKYHLDNNPGYYASVLQLFSCSLIKSLPDSFIFLLIRLSKDIEDPLSPISIPGGFFTHWVVQGHVSLEDSIEKHF